MNIRTEREEDRVAIHAVNAAAFGRDAEADLVDALREQVEPVISLIAEDGGAVVGHILFSPVTLLAYPELKVMGLAPMAVAPGHQGSGVGSLLVRAGIKQCTDLGYGAVVVLGHPEYYPRFGFVPAARFGIRCEYDVPDEAFMALELQASYLAAASGTARYHPIFGDV